MNKLPQLPNRRKQQKQISLCRWPTDSFITNPQNLSPRTSQVLKLSRVHIKEIMPISLNEFTQIFSYINITPVDIQDLYQQQTQRRWKKVKILRQLWNKLERPSKSRSKSSRKSSIHSNTEYGSNYNLGSKKSKQNGRRYLYSQKQSHTNLNTYYDYYPCNTMLPPKNPLMLSNESTRSRRNTKQWNKTPKNQSLKKQNKTCRTKNRENKGDHPSSKALKLLNRVMEKWSKVEQQQLIELQYIENHVEISQKQKKRLLRIHQIEKEEIKHQIHNIKKQLEKMKNRQKQKHKN